MVLLDTEGMVAAISRDFDANDYGQRFKVAEIIETLGDTPMIPLIVPILRSDAWEDIARIGKNHFHFNYSAISEGIYYFIRSKNRWICFCAFFYVHVVHVDEKPLKNDPALLLSLRDDPNIHLSKIATHFLDDHDKQDACMIEHFELLERVMSLKKTMLFRQIPAEKLMGLAEITQCSAYKNGTLISREGEISDHLYIIRKGSLRIVKVKNNVKTVISLLQVGETYGEIGLFNQAPRSASAIANEDCELWVIQRSALKKILLDMPEIAYNFLEVFSEKLRKSSEEVVDLHALASKNKKEYF